MVTQNPNFAITTILGIWLIYQQQFSSPADKTRYVVIVLVGGLLLTLGAFYSWQKLTKTYFGLVKSNWELVSETQVTKQKQNSLIMETKKKSLSKPKAG